MINWIIGGLIIGVTVIMVLRAVIRLKNGKGGCNCSGCDPAKRDSCGKKTQ